MLESIEPSRLLTAAAIVLAYGAFTLWCLRRGKPSRPPIDSIDDAATLVAFASQTGFAEKLAAQTSRSLGGSRLTSLAELDAARLARVNQVLFVVSTTGEGDAPDPVAAFVRNTLSRTAELRNLRYGVLALGDREYDNYCAFGHRLDGWLRHQGATALFDVVEVDNGDEGALRHWQHQLSVIGGTPDLADWETPRYDRWRLVQRTLVNPGSVGDPCYHLVVEPADGTRATWAAGDIAEIDPQNSTWRDDRILPHREYSIASIPEDGAIHLLVRQMRRPDGEAGLGSGWLTQQASLGSEVALRVRSNANFHVPTDSRPMVLIGNGTGIAGLRALVKSRIASGHRRNWLIFGERSAAHDQFYASDLERWQREGWLETLDLVFSRDQAERRYVQHRLNERSDELRQWIAAGAAIYVCGSLHGMAPAVDSALTRILGADIMEQLATQGRYRRDVY